MKCIATIAACLLCVTATAKSNCPTHLEAVTPQWKRVEKGIQYSEITHKKTAKTAALHAHLLKVKLNTNGLTLQPLRVPGKGRRIEQTIAHFQKRSVDVRAAINGDYFFFGSEERSPFGLFVANGQYLWPGNNTSSFAITSKNKAKVGLFTVHQDIRMNGATYKVTRLNTKPSKGDIALFHGDFLTETPRSWGCTLVATEPLHYSMFGKPTTLTVTSVLPGKKSITLEPSSLAIMFCGASAEAAARLKPGEQLRLTTKNKQGNQFTNVISGGPRVLKAGTVIEDFSSEAFSRLQRFYLPKSHPRTAVGVDKSGRTVFMLVAEGRVDRSSGMSARDTACIMRLIGASDAMLLDGGGSAAMVVGKKLMNQPFIKPARTWRNIANVLAVIRSKKRRARK